MDNNTLPGFAGDNTPRRGRPKTNPLTRAEQLAAAQARRRQALRDRGSNRHELYLDAEALALLQRIQHSEGCRDLGEAAAMAAAKYHARSADLTGIPAELVGELERIFPTEDLPTALVHAAARHVAELRRKRDVARRARSRK